MPRHNATEYDAIYRDDDQRPPWEIDRAQPALAAVVDTGVTARRVLDAGCGSGELSILLASKGHQVTAFDFSAAAIEQARRKAAERGLTIDFQVADALALPDELGTFDAVFDSGLLHSLLAPERPAYVATVRKVCRKDTIVHLLAMSADADYDVGLTKADLEQLFAQGFTDVRVEPTTITAYWNGPLEMPAWLLHATC